MNLSNETKFLIWEIGCALMALPPDRKYTRESALPSPHAPRAYYCLEELPNGNYVDHSLICGGMSGDEIGLTEDGMRVFEGLCTEHVNGCPEWSRETMSKDPRSLRAANEELNR